MKKAIKYTKITIISLIILPFVIVLLPLIVAYVIGVLIYAFTKGFKQLKVDATKNNNTVKKEFVRSLLKRGSGLKQN